ncbi:putative pumilio homolog 8, chloroplastic [Mangifera indica]|uniref:putative pumilio homolog 8, chloroplastic n=1 Tax=Mangifera indica TaxID=29780 RepID=UPI001CFAE12A|nr:putative pumilio homolog 8, chloroplastic [Mangifera indica]
MANTRSNRSFMATTMPFHYPIYGSSDAPLRRQSQHQQNAQTYLLNPLQETLESSFANLTLSPGSNAEFFDRSSDFDNVTNGSALNRDGFPSLAAQEMELGNFVRSLSSSGFMGLQGQNWDGFKPGFCSTSNNLSQRSADQNGFFRDFGDGASHNDLSSLSSSKQNLLLNVMVPRYQNGFLRDYGNGAFHNDLSAVSSSKQDFLFNAMVPRNPNLKSRQWLQEPFDSPSLGDLRGNIVTLAKDQYGCRLLQNNILHMTKEGTDMIFVEIIDHVCDLIIDPFGNYVVQKFVEICSDEQRTQIVQMLTNIDFQLVRICLSMHGTRAVQKLLEHLTTPQQISMVAAALVPGIVTLIKDTNGHHVIQYCLKCFPDQDKKYLLNKVVDNCFGIATDKSGCCVLQQCVEKSKGLQRERLIAEIIAYAHHLAEDRFGNYVVQHVLGLRVPQITADLLRQFEGHYMHLSCNKYGSNVVERCLIESGEQQSMRIIMELLGSPNVSMLLTDPFGNFVIQKALSVSKGLLHDALWNLVKSNIPMMRSNMYGKKVLAWFDRKKFINV